MLSYPLSCCDVAYFSWYVHVLHNHVLCSMTLQLLNHLALIRDSKHSQVTQYIQKTLRKKATSASSNGVPTAQSNPEDTMDIPLMPADLVATFSEILKKIGNPATKKQVHDPDVLYNLEFLH